jgi:hypothetical protein
VRVLHAIGAFALCSVLFTLGGRFVWGMPYSSSLRKDPRWRWSWRTSVYFGVFAGVVLAIVVYVKNVPWSSP